MRNVLLLAMILAIGFLQGCVTFGVECRRESIHGWAKARRIGWGVGKKQAESLAEFKQKVCN